jgi:hypothetical protein
MKNHQAYASTNVRKNLDTTLLRVHDQQKDQIAKVGNLMVERKNVNQRLPEDLLQHPSASYFNKAQSVSPE